MQNITRVNLTRRSCWLWVVTWAVILIGCTPGTVGTKVYRGEITRIHDGDSLHIKPGRGERVVVRLAAIDAPELTQPYGVQSRDYLRALALHQQAEAHCYKTDRYRRQLCKLFLANEDVNIKMLQAGFAWHYKRFEDEQSSAERRSYAAAEASAKRNKIGLWAGRAQAPWDYRAQQ